MNAMYYNNVKIIEFKYLCDLLGFNSDRSVIGRLVKGDVLIIDNKKYCNYWTANKICFMYNKDINIINNIYERSDKLFFLVLKFYRKFQKLLKYEYKNYRICK